MKGEYYNCNKNNSISVVIGEDGNFYAYESDERWNGEYYKGWKSDKFGYEIEKGTYNIKPIYKDVENEDLEIVDYEIWKN